MSSTNRQLIQVVPRLIPGRCGVSDQAALLAGELKSAFGIDAAFVVLNSDEKCDLPFPVTYCKPSDLLHECLSLSQSQPSAILVHVSGYGYAADGAPASLADAVRDLRSEGRFRIAGYFHELYASGMPWKSAFWHSWRQKNAIRSIAQTCDLIVTNVGLSAAWLKRQPIKPTTRPVLRLPVFSAVGESQNPILVAKREPAMVVFGLAGTRERAYKELLPLANMLIDLGVQKILDVGPAFNVPPDLHGIPVRRKGVLAGAELARELSRAKFGFISYPPNCLAKSSVFAAYCAHGAVPLIGKGFDGESDGLRDGVHLLSQRTAKTANKAGLAGCSLAAWQWYQGHRLHVHAATYAKWLGYAAFDGDAETQMPTELERT